MAHSYKFYLDDFIALMGGAALFPFNLYLIFEYTQKFPPDNIIVGFMVVSLCTWVFGYQTAVRKMDIEPHWGIHIDIVRNLSTKYLLPIGTFLVVWGSLGIIFTQAFESRIGYSFYGDYTIYAILLNVVWIALGLALLYQVPKRNNLSLILWFTRLREKIPFLRKKASPPTNQPITGFGTDMSGNPICIYCGGKISNGVCQQCGYKK